MPDRPATALHVPEAVREATSLPGRLVYTALDGRQPLTVEELVTHTGVSRRATKRALGELREADLVEADTHPVDGRRKLYTVRADAVTTPAVSTPDDGHEPPQEAASAASTPSNPRGERP